MRKLLAVHQVWLPQYWMSLVWYWTLREQNNSSHENAIALRTYMLLIFYCKASLLKILLLQGIAVLILATSNCIVHGTPCLANFFVQFFCSIFLEKLEKLGEDLKWINLRANHGFENDFNIKSRRQNWRHLGVDPCWWRVWGPHIRPCTPAVCHHLLRCKVVTRIGRL